MIEAAVLDWAGTVIDYGCIAPTFAFSRVLADEGIILLREEINRYMGMSKIEHLKRLVRDHAQKLDNEHDIARLYESYRQHLRVTVRERLNLIPGALPAVNELRGMGLKIGSSTGYPDEIMDVVAPAAGQQGYWPDAVFTSDMCESRPSPDMLYSNSVHLGVYPMNKIVKIGDTVSDIQAAVNAGCPSIGIVLGGSLVPYDKDQVDANLNDGELTLKICKAERALLDAGATKVARSITDVPRLVRELMND